jgi:hypothetical protein
VEYHRVTGDRQALAAAQQAGALFLQHHLFLSERTGKVIDRRWLVPHYPPYWHYDIFQALLVLSRFAAVADPRADAALDAVERKRTLQDRWKCGPRYWRLAQEKASKPIDIVDWGRTGPNKMATLNALRILKAAGRLADSCTENTKSRQVIGRA